MVLRPDQSNLSVEDTPPKYMSRAGGFRVGQVTDLLPAPGGCVILRAITFGATHFTDSYIMDTPSATDQPYLTPATLGAIYGILAASIWGGMYIVSDVVLETIPPFTLLVTRLVLGIIVLWFWGMRRRPGVRRMPLPPRADVLRLLGVGMVGFGVSVGAQFVGTDYLTAVNGALITSASPAFILAFAVPVLAERFTRVDAAAVVLATVGVLIIVDPRAANFSSDTFVGDVSLAIAAVTWGLYSVLVRRVSRRYGTLLVTFLAFVGGLLLVTPLAAIELRGGLDGDLTPGIGLGVLYLGVISTAVAMWMWNRAFALVPANRASLFFFAQPVVGTLLGVLVLDQPLAANVILGGVLILSGVLIPVLASSHESLSSASPLTPLNVMERGESRVMHSLRLY